MNLYIELRTDQKKKKKRLFYRDWLMRSMRDMSIDYLLLSEE